MSDGIEQNSKNYLDAYFKQIFSKPEYVKDLLQGMLPKLAKNLDFKTLQLDKTSYVNKSLKNEYSDLVYNCKFGKEKVKIALLFEHKSEPKEYIEFQLAKYIFSIWRYNVKAGEELLPVIPILFHQSLNKPKLNAFGKLKELPEVLQRYLPIFEVELMDISKMTGKDITTIFQSAQTKFAVMAMRYIIDDPNKFFEELMQYRHIVKNLLQLQDGEDLLFTTTIYYSKKPGTDMEDIVNNFEKIEKQAGEVAKSAWEIEFEKGIEKGKIEGKIETAIEMLKYGLDIQFIQQITGLTLEQIEKLKEEL